MNHAITVFISACCIWLTVGRLIALFVAAGAFLIGTFY